MRFMVFVPGNEESEAGVMPSEADFAEMGRFNEELVNAGVMLAGEGLHPTSKGAKIRFEDGKQTVIDGPFTEAKELVAGFWIVQAGSKAEVVDWFKKAPFDGGVELEIRQIFDADDFGDALTPDLRDQEDQLRAKIAEQHPQN